MNSVAVELHNAIGRRVKQNKPRQQQKRGIIASERPADFDIDKIQKLPIFQNYASTAEGAIFRYAKCEYIGGDEYDEERLMRKLLSNNRSRWQRDANRAAAPKNTPWSVMYDQLVTYKQEYGDCNVSATLGDNKKLGTWVSHQRKNFKNQVKGYQAGKSSDRYIELTKIGFVWKVDWHAARNRTNIHR